MKFAFYTLGCKVNQYETQAMEHRLQALGHTLGAFDEPCDGYIINTCTVTAVADKKNRNVIRRCRKLAPDAVIGVCGCYAQVEPDAVRALGVDVISGSAGREEFLDMMLTAVREHRKLEAVDNALRRRTFEFLPAGGLANRTRAMLKVQDGCSNFCTYCIIPYARGPVRSMPRNTAVEQAKRLQREGYRELVVTGIEIASWGADFKDGSCLRELLAAICQAVPEMRVRIGSLEPRVVDEEFCRALCVFDNLCPHFHLSMQSGCDTVLQRMHRRYDTARYAQSVALLRRFFPGCAVTTDMIVAFPGETEEEFHQSLEFIRRCAFADMHIFPYSRRPGTPADKMDGQLSTAVKQARAAEAGAVAAQMSQTFRQGMVGSVQRVLFEQADGADFTGHAMNSVLVYLRGEGLHNQVREVRITGLYRDGVRGVEITRQDEADGILQQAAQ